MILFFHNKIFFAIHAISALLFLWFRPLIVESNSKTKLCIFVLQREAEERIAREEEIERLRLEKVQLDAERKEKKKQREKERKERLKAEGKLLTSKQKLEQARAQAMLESLRAQGVELPEAGAKKSRPGTRVRPNKKNQQAANQMPSDERDEPKLDETATQGEEKQEIDTAVEPVVVEEKIKDSWDASSSEDESSEVAEPKSATTAVKTQQNTSKKSAQSTKQTAPKKPSTPKQSESEASDDSDEESESESDDESEEDTKTDAEKKKEKAWERIMVRFYSIYYYYYYHLKMTLYYIEWAKCNEIFFIILSHRNVVMLQSKNVA